MAAMSSAVHLCKTGSVLEVKSIFGTEDDTTFIKKKGNIRHMRRSAGYAMLSTASIYCLKLVLCTDFMLDVFPDTNGTSCMVDISTTIMPWRLDSFLSKISDTVESYVSFSILWPRYHCCKPNFRAGFVLFEIQNKQKHQICGFNLGEASE